MISTCAECGAECGAEMDTIERLHQKANEDTKRIVLPEGHDPRILQAAMKASQDGIADVVLVGDRLQINACAIQCNGNLSGIELIDPAAFSNLEDYAGCLYEKRQHKGITVQQAVEIIRDPLVFATVMVARHDADGMVAGAVLTTADVVRTAIQVIGMDDASDIVSSFFLIVFDKPFHDLKGSYIFSDCGLMIEPDTQQLASIAISSVRSAWALLDDEPRVAMLSFSTQGSASHACVSRVAKATQLVRKRMPKLLIDGEIQLDAALIPEICNKKVTDSKIMGRANILIFPNLEAGNIGYKIAEKFGQAIAIGPLLQGLRYPANDLSRGCSVNDIYNVIAATSVQAI